MIYIKKILLRFLVIIGLFIIVLIANLLGMMYPTIFENVAICIMLILYILFMIAFVKEEKERHK